MDENTPKKLELLWTIKQVAAYFSVSIVTVQRWVREGTMFRPEAIIRLPGARVRIPRSEVERAAGTQKEAILTDITNTL